MRKRKPPVRRDRASRLGSRPITIPDQASTIGDEGPSCPLDLATIASLSDLVDVIRVEGQAVPIVRPLEDYECHADFDRRLCDAGLKTFVREIMPSDKPQSGDVAGLAVARHVIVVEIQPGIRGRQGILVVLNHEMN